MKISTKGRYALRVMIDLATHQLDDYISLKDIANRQGISVKYSEQIIAQLNKAGYLKSSRGHNGGYRLKKDPAFISVGEVLRTMEGGLSVISCLEDNPNECERSDSCPTLAFWEGFNTAINSYVDQFVLADLMITN